MMLHIVNQSPLTSPALADCLHVVQPGDALLLIEDAVFAVLDETHQQLVNLLPEVKVMLLSNDVLARGLKKKITTLPTINYVQFVELTEQYYPSLSWN